MVASIFAPSLLKCRAILARRGLRCMQNCYVLQASFACISHHGMHANFTCAATCPRLFKTLTDSGSLPKVAV